MNNDGWGQQGAGTSDMRQGGNDLQHAVQHTNSGGPMKEHSHPDLKQLILDEKSRHDQSMAHHAHHMDRHHKRPHDGQHGHDDNAPQYSSKYEM